MAKRVNPRRIPRTEADCVRAWNEGADFGLTFCIKAFLFVLKAKHDANDLELMQLRDEFEEVLDSFNKHDITQADLDSVLDDEFNLRITIR